MGKKPEVQSNEITIVEVHQQRITFCVLGTSPLIYNAMSEKAWHELLMPSGKKNAAERASTLKHVPIDEFRNSVYRNGAEDAPTLLNFPSAAFKKATASSALDTPGAAKSQIGRLLWADGDRVNIYGVPQILCAIVRNSDINHTPDVRTRAILPEWACHVTMSFMKPMLTATTVGNLFAAAGLIRGVGDWRQEKGSGSYGQFKLVSADDRDFARVMKQGRAAQVAAMEKPVPYDDETLRLLSWFDGEVKRRDVGGKNGSRREKEVAESAS